MNASPEPDLPTTLPGERLVWRDVLLLLVGCVPMFVALGQMQAYTGEGRALGIALSMRQKGTWLTPDLYGEFWGFKPLLYFWCVAVASYVTGGVTELAGRLPAALSGAATVVMTGAIAARLFGRRAAVLAGWVLATAFSFWLWSRVASADTMNVAFATAAILVYVDSIVRFRRWQPFVFFLLMGLGGNAKGLPAIILPIGVAGADILLNRRRELIREIKWFVAALPLGAAAYFLSYVLNYAVRHDWQMLSYMWWENVKRIYDPYDHHDNAFPYYFYILPAMFAPWSLWFPGAIGWAAKHFWQNRGLRFALTAFVVIFTAFTASASRRSYYILPIFPWCAILVAGYIVELTRKQERAGLPGRLTPIRAGEPDRLWRALADWPLATLFVILPFAALALAAGRFLPGDPGVLVRTLPAGLVLVCLLSAAFGFFCLLIPIGVRDRLFIVSIALLLPLFVYAATAVDSLRDRLIPERPFAQEMRKRFPGGKWVYYRVENSQMFFQLGQETEFYKPEDLRNFVAHSGTDPAKGYLVVTDGKNRKRLEECGLFRTETLIESHLPAIPYRKRVKEGYCLLRVWNR